MSSVMSPGVDSSLGATIIPSLHRPAQGVLLRRPVTTVWLCAHDSVAVGLGLLASWLLAAMVKVVTAYSLPWDRVLVVESSSTRLRKASRRSGADVYSGLAKAVWLIVRLGHGSGLGFSVGVRVRTLTPTPLGRPVLARDLAVSRVLSDGLFDVVVAVVDPGDPTWARPSRCGSVVRVGGVMVGTMRRRWAYRFPVWPDGAVLDLGTGDPRLELVGLRGRAGMVATTIRTSLCPDLDSHLRDAVRTLTDLLRPGGRVVVVLWPRRSADVEFLDLPGAVNRAAPSMGLVLFDRRAAFTAKMRDGRITPHSSRGQGRRCVVAHDTVLVLQDSAFVERAEAVQAVGG